MKKQPRHAHVYTPALSGYMRSSTLWRRAVVNGVPAREFFAALREQILSDLKHNRNDKSIASRVDPQIAGLVAMINDTFTSYVTTSSCSGRISLFHRGKHSEVAAVEQQRCKRGSFGRGTLFQSHDPLPCVEDTVRGALVPALGQFWEWRKEVPHDTLVAETELLQLKFEPMIVHILCADVEAASQLLQCASESGQMNSGILSCSRGTRDFPKITCCITSPLSMDIPLFAHGAWLLPDTQFSEVTWTTLLERAVVQGNALFEENVKRTLRFQREMERRLKS